MPVLGDRVRAFIAFAQALKGDEKGEAQSYINALMVAFGHEGAIQAGGKFERRIKAEKSTLFADYELPGRVLIEMKKAGENLADHYHQAFNYWLELVPNRPPYVILCNFNELWIFDFNRQLRAPLQKIPLAELGEKDNLKALRILEASPTPLKAEFKDDHVKVTTDAADLVSSIYKSLVGKEKSDRKEFVALDVAQRYILQCVVALFSEDAGLLPDKLFERILHEGNILADSYDVIGSLFRQMNDPRPATGGRFKGVDYFNGGLFSHVDPIELTLTELLALRKASKSFDWDEVEPEIFGTLFQKSMEKEVRHAYGAHYTFPIDIMKVVTPTIVRPWDRAIDAAQGYEALNALRGSLSRYRVLDPACGSGNFLYIAYRELKAVERRLLRRMLDADRSRTLADLGSVPFVSTRQFFGMDVLPFAVELAKVTLMLAKELAIMRPEGDDPEVAELVGRTDAPLPFDNLDGNIVKADALFDPWPEADAIVGNPPYQDARAVTQKYGRAYVNRLHDAYPDVPGRSDFCVYFFRRAHDALKPGGRAGLVGTNSIRQNDSRVGGLDHIVSDGGVILDAVSTQPWSGEAAVHVSIVNWAKPPDYSPLPSGGEGTAARGFGGQMGFALLAENPLMNDEIDAPKTLWWIDGDRPDGSIESLSLRRIPSSLTRKVDTTGRALLVSNSRPKRCVEGQQPGHTAFVIGRLKAREFELQRPANRSILHPYLRGEDLLDSRLSLDLDYVIDFVAMNSVAASTYKEPFEYLRRSVLTKWQENANREQDETGKKSGEHQKRAGTWWILKRRRSELMSAISHMPRYLVRASTSSYGVFEFISPDVHPSNAIKAFLFADDYAFGILQATTHDEWAIEIGSTFKADDRYTPTTVFASFPWPQSPTPKACRGVADAAVALRALRRSLMAEHDLSYRALYRTLETPGKNPLRDAQDALDRAVRAAYGMPADADPLAFLLDLNLALAAKEAAGEAITPPGLPRWIEDREGYVTDDCIRPAPP